MESPSYKDKLKSLGWVAKPTTSKRTQVINEENGKHGGFHTERGKPGTGVSEGIDATVQGGTVKVNPNIKFKKDGKIYGFKS